MYTKSTAENANHRDADSTTSIGAVSKVAVPAYTMTIGQTFREAQTVLVLRTRQ